MKRTTSALTLALALLLFLTVTVPCFQVANATSKTFQLMDQAYQGMDFVELQKGDYIKGSFVVTNLGPYKNLLYGTMDTYWVNVKCGFEATDQSAGQIIFDYKGTSGGSFSYTASYAGKITLSTFCSNGNPYFQDAKTPEIIFDFNVLEAIPTRINVLSPLNQTYYESRLFLNFTANNPLSWVGYSLDGKDNVTIHSNTTLTELPNGLHKITVYANNTYGNLVSPETTSFNVEVPEPFPTVPAAAASVAVVAAVIAGLLIYFKKRKH
jgi:hypothetical protein